MQFNPTPEVPALQYVGNVEEGGAADKAGLRKGDFIVAVNGYDTTLSTHDDVVNIVRKSGGTLFMKVITPAKKPKSVSQQIKSHFTPVNTPRGGGGGAGGSGSTSRKKSMKENDSPHPPKLGKSDSLSVVTFKPPTAAVESRETVIDSSPVLPRTGGFEWDSHAEESHGEEEEEFPSNTPILPTSPPPSLSILQQQEDAYPLRSSSFSNLYNQQLQPQRSPSQSSTHGFEISFPSTSSPSSRSNRKNTLDAEFSSKSKTLPVRHKHSLAPDLSKYATTSDSDRDSDDSDDQDDSAFAAALRKSREKLQRSSSRKGRGSPIPTPPLPGSPLTKRQVMVGGGVASSSAGGGGGEGFSNPAAGSPADDEDVMSPLQKEILKASKARSDRVSMNQARVTDVTKTTTTSTTTSATESSRTFEKNSLARALSQKLDSMNMKMDSSPSPTHSDSDFDSSPKLVPFGSRIGSSSSPASRVKKSASAVGESSKTAAKKKVPPPSVKPKPGKKSKQQDSSSDVRATVEGEKDETVANVMSSSSSISSSALPFEVKLRSTPKATMEAKPHGHNSSADNDTSGEIDWKSKLKPSGSKGRESPLLTTRKKGSTNGHPAQEETGPNLDRLPSNFILPPPIPDSDEKKRMSFIEAVAPPDGFTLEMEETVLSDIPPVSSSSPPALTQNHLLSSEDHMSSPSPPLLPPSLPDSSPPPKLPSAPDVFVFPDAIPPPKDSGNDNGTKVESGSSGMTDLFAPPVSDFIDLPSPIPSPVLERRELMCRSASPIAPPDFEADDFFIPSDDEKVTPTQDMPCPESPTSVSSETPPPLPSEPPPPLPSSEPPPLLDSDTSLDHSPFDAHPPAESASSSRSSIGSSPQSYNVMLVGSSEGALVASPSSSSSSSLPQATPPPLPLSPPPQQQQPPSASSHPPKLPQTAPPPPLPLSTPPQQPAVSTTTTTSTDKTRPVASISAVHHISTSEEGKEKRLLPQDKVAPEVVKKPQKAFSTPPVVSSEKVSFGGLCLCSSLEPHTKKLI